MVLSKAHVPPKCAGNKMLVKRHHFTRNGHEADAGRSTMGGIHFYGLCGDCNTLAGQYDEAYGVLASGLRPLWVKSWRIEVPPRIQMPSIEFDPGSVVRSILLGMCATGELIYRNWPSLPSDLTNGQSVQLPSDMRLYLALARGMTARVAGSMSGFQIYGPNARRNLEGAPIGINALASVYFPPMAWELVQAGDTTLDADGWVNVSDWTQYLPNETHRLPDLVSALPSVCHPWHHPVHNEGWFDLMNINHVPIVECENIEGGPRDPDAPLTVTKRAVVSIDEYKEMARRNGMVI
ncbi:hypothetical protein [Mycolicibacterium sp. HS_4_1]